MLSLAEPRPLYQKQFIYVHNELRGKGIYSYSRRCCDRIKNILLRFLALALWAPSFLVLSIGHCAHRFCCLQSKRIEQNRLKAEPLPEVPSIPVALLSTIQASAQRFISATTSTPMLLPQLSQPTAVSTSVVSVGIEIDRKGEADRKEDGFGQELAKIADEDDFRKTVEERYEGGAEDVHLLSLISKRHEILKLRKTSDAPPIRLFTAGAGPGGLMAAISAYLAGATVVIAEARPDFVRDQILRLDSETVDDIRNVIGVEMARVVDAMDFLSRRFQGYGLRKVFPVMSYWVTEIKDLQFILYALLKRLANIEQVKGLTEMDDKGLTILGGYEFTGFDEPKDKEKDASRYLVRVKEKASGKEQLISADWVCAADGVHSAIANAATIKAEPTSDTDAYAAITFDHPYPDDSTRAEMLVNTKDPKTPALPQVVIEGIAEIRALGTHNDAAEDRLIKIERTRQRTWIVAEEEILDKTIDVNHLREWQRRVVVDQHIDEEVDLDTVRRGRIKHWRTLMEEWEWKKMRLPTSRFFTSPKTVYLGCEVPMHLLEKLQKDRHEALKWARTVLRAHLPQNHIDDLQARKVAVFPVQLMKREVVKVLVKPEGDPTYVFPIGDALATPHFLTGSGAIAAMKVAKRFGQFLKEVQENRKNFLSYLQQYHKDVSAIITAMQNKAFDNNLLQRHVSAPAVAVTVSTSPLSTLT